MRQKAGRRRCKKVLWGCAIGIAVVFLPVAAWWAVRYCRVEIAVHAFQSNPSQAGTDRLIALLDKRSPTHGQAARILKLLLWPKVATRSAYPVGRKPTLSVAIPFYLHFHTTMRYQVDVLADGQSRPTSNSSTYFGTMPHVLVSPVAPDKPGKFSTEVRYHYLLAPSSEGSQFYFVNPFGRFLRHVLTRMKMEPWLPPPRKTWYQVRFNVPVEVAVVEEAKAEQVQLLSNPELDSLMRAAFRSSDQPRASNGLHMFHILGKRLPADMAFRCILELPDGTRMSSPRPEYQGLRAYAGRDFDVSLSVDSFAPKRFGEYEAKFVFEPDPNYAFEEPTIKSIWNGTLEFPVHFTIAPEPNTGQ
jgi:hypothetical protein